MRIWVMGWTDSVCSFFIWILYWCSLSLLLLWVLSHQDRIIEAFHKDPTRMCGHRNEVSDFDIICVGSNWDMPYIKEPLLPLSTGKYFLLANLWQRWYKRFWMILVHFSGTLESPLLHISWHTAHPHCWRGFFLTWCTVTKS